MTHQHIHTHTIFLLSFYPVPTNIFLPQDLMTSLHTHSHMELNFAFSGTSYLSLFSFPDPSELSSIINHHSFLSSLFSLLLSLDSLSLPVPVRTRWLHSVHHIWGLVSKVIVWHVAWFFIHIMWSLLKNLLKYISPCLALHFYIDHANF